MQLYGCVYVPLIICRMTGTPSSFSMQLTMHPKLDPCSSLIIRGHRSEFIVHYKSYYSNCWCALLRIYYIQAGDMSLSVDTSSLQGDDVGKILAKVLK